MKRGWQTKLLGDCCDLTSGATPSKSNPRFWVGDIPFVSARDLKSDRIKTAFLHVSREAVAQSAAKLAPVGTLLILVRGMGLANGIQVGEVTAPVAFNQDIRAIHPPVASLLPRFLLLALRHSFMTGVGDDLLSSAAHGTLKINADVLRRIEIPLPPLPEQQRIVGILDEAFERVAIAKVHANKNFKSARALFESQLQFVFSQRGKDWDENQLDALTEADSPITYGVVKPGDEGDIRFVRGGDLVRGGVRLDQLRTITRAVSNQYRRTLLKGGELLICLVGQPGQVAVAPLELAGANIARQVGLIRLKRTMDAEFVRYFLQSATGGEALGARQSGSVQQVINLGELRHLRVPYPPLQQQHEIVCKLASVEDDTQRLARLYERKLTTLDTLKKSLLHQAFTGQL